MLTRRRLTRSSEQVNLCLLPKVEPKKFTDTRRDDGWIKEMEEMDQIEKNQTWELVPRLADKNGIGKKWVF